MNTTKNSFRASIKDLTFLFAAFAIFTLVAYSNLEGRIGTMLRLIMMFLTFTAMVTFLVPVSAVVISEIEEANPPTLREESTPELEGNEIALNIE